MYDCSSLKQIYMNRKDTNRLNMIDTTVDYCELNAADTAAIINFAIVILAIKAKLVLISALNQIGTGTTKGVTIDTNLLRRTMTDLALKCANATIGYANSVNNNTLKALVNFTKSSLDKLSKEDVDDVCKAIHDATSANAANVVSYGVVATDITDLLAAINLFRTATQNPRQAIITKSQAILQSKVMVREVIDDLLVGQLDVMANTLKLSNYNYWTGYYQAREIVDLGSTTAKVRGTVLDMNDVPIQQADFTIYETGTLIKRAEVSTDIKGKYKADHLPSGDFDFKWEKHGYGTLTETNVHIGPGKELNRKVVLHALVTLEGDLMMMMVGNIDLQGNGIEATSIITIEAVNSPMRFYTSNSPAGLPGAQFIDVQAGQSITKTVQEFLDLVGQNQYTNVQNVGGVMGHWKVIVEV